MSLFEELYGPPIESNPTQSKPPLTVTQLNQTVRQWLEHEMGEVCVEGELSNVSRPSSGHFYFTLKDSGAQLRCVFFKNRHHTSQEISIENGQKVVAKGYLSLYEARGDYQLIVDSLKGVGFGDLFHQFEVLKQKLLSLGLFDKARKKPLPQFPKKIGVITSANAAALRDILTTLARRYPLANVIVYPSEVQGKNAHIQLINAIKKANFEPQCDVLILARGGGSIEDLWAFNHEQLAYAIVGSTIPIVSGVGHETDFTIADFVADLRAATPTAAAEAVSPDSTELLSAILHMKQQLQQSLIRTLNQRQLLLKHALVRLTSPANLIQKYWQNIDHLTERLFNTCQKHQLIRQQQLQTLNLRLMRQNPLVQLKQNKTKLEHLESRCILLIQQRLNQAKGKWGQLAATLHAVSPLATLERGYSITMCEDKVIFDSQQLKRGDIIETRLAKGKMTSTVC